MRSKLNIDSVTHWPIVSTNDFGEEQFGAPVLIDARWEDRVTNIRLATGEEYQSKATVFTDVELALGSKVAQGDYTAVADPDLAGAYEVREVMGIPSMRTNQTEWRAML